VPIPNAEHLLDQAERLIAPVGPGAPRQVDLRRAISSAYYAVFHAVLAAAADEFVGWAQRAETAYGLVYRRIDHGALRELCAELNKPSADYDPMIRLKRSDALLAVSSARSALARLRDTSPDVRRIFLALLLFPPR
jgi:hypothetical protein